MFSYRHAFHAANHGDVLKHCILLHWLEYLKLKDKPFWFIDTHAGAGVYALDAAWSRQSSEADLGLGKILQNQQSAPAMVRRYIAAIVAFNQHYPGKSARGQAQTQELPKLYPGSPALALQALRAHDKIRLFELHPSEIDVLNSTLQGMQIAPRQLKLMYEDGFKGLLRLLPPASNRGLVLIDPSYEDKNDYKHVLEALRGGLQRFAHGGYMVWYPLVQRTQAQHLARALERLRVNWLHATLKVRKPSSDGLGMHGSGVFMINPPYTLAADLKQALPWLAKTLAQDNNSGFSMAAR